MQNKLDRDYLGLVKKVLEKGNVRNDRTDTGVLSLFGEQMYFPMSAGFPILTSKHVSIKTVATELKWFLKGHTNIRYLVKNNCNIWTGDAYKKYKKVWDYDLDEPLSIEDFTERIKTDDDFARVWGELGPIYGKQWRCWFNYDQNVNRVMVDQIKELLNKIKTDPTSRRLIVSAWNVGEIEKMVLPPCHYSFQCYVNDGHLELIWNQRSADLFLGVPFNLASYGLLLHLIAFETGLKPGKLGVNLGDVHIYQNHIDQCYEQMNQKTYPLPNIEILSSDILKGEFEYRLINYKHSPSIKAPLNN